MDKKCNKFLKALAKNLVEGEDHLRNKSLKKVFTKAVKRLPESKLKSTIQEHFTEAFLYLKIRIKKLKDKVEKTLDAVKLETLDSEDNDGKQDEENGEMERLSIDNSAHDFPFNFYLKNNTTDKLNSSAANQYFLKKIQECSNQENVVKLVKEYQRLTEETTVISALDHLLVLTSGIKDLTLIKKLLFVFLKKMQPLVEKYLEEENLNKIAVVQEDLHKLLCVSQMRYNSSKTSMNDDKPLYKDLIASLVSMYLDLSVFLFRNEVNKIKLSRLLYGFVNGMLKDFPEQKYDVLLQLTQTHTDQMELLYPLLQFCVERKREITDAPSYIKYILSVAMANNNGRQTQLTFQDAIKRARSVVPPGDVEKWLEDHELSDILDENEDINSLTLFLLDTMTDDLQTKLIDGLCDDESVDVKEEEEEDVEDDVVVFNPLVNDSSFFTTSSTAELEEKEFEDIFMVDKKGSQTDNSKEKLPSQDQSLIDEPEVENTRKSEKKNKSVTSTSSLIKSSHKMVAVVSPNRKIKPVVLEEEFVKSAPSAKEKISDEKDDMHVEQDAPKLQSTAKYLKMSPKLPYQKTEMETISGSPKKSPKKLRYPDKITQKSAASLESNSSISPSIPGSQKSSTTHSGVKTPKMKSATPSEIKPVTISSITSSEVKSLKIKSPPLSNVQTPAVSSDVKTQKSTNITSPTPSAMKMKITTDSPTSEVKTPKMKSSASSDSDNKPVKRNLQTPQGVKTPKTKNPTKSDNNPLKIESPMPSDIEKAQIESPTPSGVKTPKIKSPTSEVKTPKTKTGVKTPKIKSPTASDVKTPNNQLATQSVVKTPKVKTPKIKSPTPSDVKPPKIRSPNPSDIKTPKIKSPTLSDIKSPKIKSPPLSDVEKPHIKTPKINSPTPSDVQTPKMESSTLPDVKTPKIKSPTQSSIKTSVMKSPTSSDSELKEGKIILPKPSDVNKNRIKSPDKNRIKSPVPYSTTSDIKTSTVKSPSLSVTKSPKLKSKNLSSQNMDDDKETFKSPKTSLTIKSSMVSARKSALSSDLEIISLSSDSSIEVNGKSVRKGSRIRKPSSKFLLSQASALSTGDDTESDKSVVCLTPKDTKIAPKANKRESLIKQYTIISDSENTDLEQPAGPNRKRSSDVPIPDLTVHLNKSRRTSLSVESDSKQTPSKLKLQKRKSTPQAKSSLTSPQSGEDENSLAASDKSPKNAKLTGKEMHSVLEKVCNKLEVVKENEIMTVTTTKTKLTSDITKVRSPINLRRRSTSESGIPDTRHVSKRRSGTISDDEISSKIKAQPTPAKTSKIKQATGEKDDPAIFSDPSPVGKNNKSTEKSSSPSKTKSSPKKSQSDGDVGTKSKSAQKSPSKRYSLRSR